MKKLLLAILIIVTALGAGWMWMGYNIASAFPSPHALEYDEKTFMPLARAILAQNEITSMDDCTRDVKRVNGVNITMQKVPDNVNTDASAVSGVSRAYFKEVLDSLHIRHDLFSDLRHQLEATELREFYRSGDSILFVVDGFLDGSWGFLYAASPLNDDCAYFDFAGYTVNALDHVHAHWRRVSIH